MNETIIRNFSFCSYLFIELELICFAYTPLIPLIPGLRFCVSSFRKSLSVDENFTYFHHVFTEKNEEIFDDDDIKEVKPSLLNLDFVSIML